MTDGIRKKLWLKQEIDLVYKTNIYIYIYIYICIYIYMGSSKQYMENNLKQRLGQKK